MLLDWWVDGINACNEEADAVALKIKLMRDKGWMCDKGLLIRLKRMYGAANAKATAHGTEG